MKNKRVWIALGALALCAATVVYGDYNVLSKGTYYQNATNGATTDASGNALVLEAEPVMDANLTFPSIISLSTLAGGAADSSGILDTHRMRLGMLLIKATPTSVTGADSGAVIRLGVQIRTHLNGSADSSSTFAMYMYGRTDQGANVAAASQIDTSAVGQLFTADNLTANANSVWSGEFVVHVQVRRLGPTTSVLGGLGQRTYAYPNGMAIPLQSIFGREIYSPYTSIRIRHLGNSGPTARSCIVTAHLVGTPL